MLDDSQSIVGSNNIAVLGSYNTIENNMILPAAPTISKSEILNLLNLFESQFSNDEGDYSLELPVPIQDKLERNNAFKYVHKFKNYSSAYIHVDEVLADFPNSERIVKRLHSLFLDSVSYCGDGSISAENGDVTLDSVKNKVKTIICNDSRICQNSNLTEELLEEFCTALVACGVAKCKILKNVDDDATA